MIVGGVILMWVGRFPDRSSDEALSAWGGNILLIFAALFMIPEGPQPPDD